jgi:hypothetical protein
MKVKVSRDILVSCADLIKNYFLVMEFSGSKISSYDKAIYNALKDIINNNNKGKKNEHISY